MLRPLPSLAAALCVATSVLSSQSTTDPADGARLLRYPHVQGDRIAFVKGGDIWVATKDDLRARRLTSYDEGLEVFPRISPDGSLVAFSGEYAGTRQIYVVPFEGGAPRQLTFQPDVGPMPPRGGYDMLPYDWTPDGRHILVKANRTPYGQRVARYELVAVDGKGMPEPLQVPEGGPATFSPDGSKLAYNIISREWRTWKRYTAGRAQDVWTYDLTGNKVTRLTTFEGTDNWPMWVGDRVYFTSDRADGTLNIWCHELASGAERQVTRFTDFDVLFPARGEGGIAFECGGSVHLLDTATEEVTRLDITLADDRPWTRPVVHEGERAFGDFTLSPSAKRTVLEFRGELFSVPVEHGEIRNLTNTPGRRERDPEWSPDGTRLAYVAEHGLEQELFVRSFGFGQETRLTTGTGAWILDHTWAPKSDLLVVTDSSNRLWTVDATTREVNVLDQDDERIGGVQWSACGTWLTYVKQSDNGHGAIWLVAADGDDAPVQITDDEWDDSAPTFDRKGRYLYFSSARDYVYGDHEFENRVYAVLLRDDVEHPLAFRDDAEPNMALGSPPATESKDEAEELEIDLDGIQQRIVTLPLPSGRYFALIGMDDGFLHFGGGGLHRYDLDSRKSSEVLPGVRAISMTPDRKKMLYRSGSTLALAGSTPGQRAGTGEVDLDGLSLRVLPPTEWTQMYTDAWRIMRDWFYDPNMHGVDWEAMRAKYLPLVPHIAHRSDLDFLIGELIGELNCGHTYVQPGETPAVDRIDVGTLGCEFEMVDGRYRIARIFDGENWNEETRSPLTEPGVDVAVGDYLLAIDGEELHASDNPYRLLVGKAGRHVELLVHDRPSTFGARKAVVRTGSGDQPLRYLTWVNRNRRIVDELSGGRIGYIHCPNTAVPGHRELFEGWRSQALVKDAMIIDDRYNGGGFVPVDMAMELAQPLLNYWARRHQALGPTPQYAFDGPMTMLINGYSSSGGDAFPYYFRKLGLGKLIGQRTWGGLVGYSGTPRLVDGGGLAVPNFAFVNTDGEWDVEAFGVAPDMEVFDDPTQIQAGREPTLEAAVRHLLQELETSPVKPRPGTPEGPNRRGLVDPKTAPDPRDR